MKLILILALTASAVAQSLTPGPGPLYTRNPTNPAVAVRQANIFNPPLNSTAAYVPSQWSNFLTALTARFLRAR